jgi:tetratricopeptide (TPR) repeat protein
MRPSGPSTSTPDSAPALAAQVLGWAALATVLATGLLLCWHSLGILDIWLHDRAGQDILQGQGLTGLNTYSYTQPDHPWLNHEWLFQVIVARVGPGQATDPGAGISRWNLLRTGLGGLLMILLLLPGKCQGRFVPRAWLALPSLMGLLLLWPRLVLRPELVSFILLVLLVRILDRPLARWAPTGRWTDLVHPGRPLGQSLLVTVLWAQFHGFSALGPALWLLALASAWLGPRIKATRQESQGSPEGRLWLLSLPLLLAALCLSPNGLQGLLYPLRALGQFGSQEVDLRRTISELAPLLETRDSLGLTLLAYRVSLVWGLIWVIATWGRTSLLRVLLWGLAAWAAYLSQRNIGIYGLAFILLHGGTSGSWLVARFPAFRRPVPPAVVAAAGLALALLGAVPWWLQITGDDFYLTEGVSRRFGSGPTVGRYPETAARILSRQPGTRLFTNVDGAAYLLDRAGASLFIDGRTEAYSPDHWKTYDRIKQGDDRALQLLGSSAPEAVWLSVQSGAFQPLARALMTSERWRLDFMDESGLLFYPTGSAVGRSGVLSHQLPRDLKRKAGDLPATRGADLCLAWSLTMDSVGNREDQEKALRLGLELRPDHPALQHNLGNILLQRGDPAAALPLFAGALATNPRLAGSALNAGVCHLRLGDPARARDSFARATRITPASVEAWANLGASFMALGDDEEARRALGRALELQPGNPRVRQMLRQLGPTRH